MAITNPDPNCQVQGEIRKAQRPGAFLMVQHVPQCLGGLLRPKLMVWKWSENVSPVLQIFLESHFGYQFVQFRGGLTCWVSFGKGATLDTSNKDHIGIGSTSA